jgi:hypothetical protein
VIKYSVNVILTLKRGRLAGVKHDVGKRKRSRSTPLDEQ